MKGLSPVHRRARSMARGLIDGQRPAPRRSYARGALKHRCGRTRHGHHVICDILCKCAQAARMTKSTLAFESKRLRVRKSHDKTFVAVAHQMMRLICIRLSRREPDLDQAIDDAAILARKSARRWIRPLKAIRKCIGACICEWPATSAPAATTTH